MAFQYFPDAPMYSQGVLLALNAGGDINEVDRACRGFAERGESPSGVAWHESWSAVADVVAGQASADEAADRLLSAAHKHRASTAAPNSAAPGTSRWTTSSRAPTSSKRRSRHE
jgi:hypothetical protein